MSKIPTSDQPAVTEENPITLTIHKMEILGTQLKVTRDGILSVDKDIDLADIVITNLGTDEAGMAPKEIARHIMDVVQPQVMKALVSIDAPEAVTGLVDGAADTVEKGASGVLGVFGIGKKKEE